MNSAGQLSDEERLDWYRLSQTENVGPITFHQLINRFHTAARAIEAIPELAKRGGARRGLRLCSPEQAQATLLKTKYLGARYVAACEIDYPAWLRQIPAAPPGLFIQGELGLLRRPALAIVGARNASAVGMRFTRTLSSQFGRAGLVVVSGLARGIDTAAHDASLETGTIAVVAGGIDHFYPPENEQLQQAISKTGLLVSENPPGVVPKSEHFPRRNRIISGLARGTVIVEAAMRSGSLITARFANEQGRDVFAVPGSPLDPRCEGTNKLIKDGAHLLTHAQDVLEVLNLDAAPLLSDMPHASTAEFEEAPTETRENVLQLLSPTPIGFDDLLRETGATADVVMGIVLELEIAGLAVRHSGGRIARSS